METPATYTTAPLTPRDAGAIISPQQRTLLLTVRQALIMILGALEDYLGMERSIVPKHKRLSV